MLLDLPTLFIVVVLANATASALLLLSWSQHRDIPALAIWGAGFALGTVATVLITARGQIPDFWSIIAGNAVLTLAYGTMWSGVRSFEGRPRSLVVMAAGTVVWLAACQFDSFYRSLESRALLIALTVVGYVLLSSWELWRSREQGLFSRWPAIIVLLLHAATFLARISLVVSWAAAPQAFVLRLDWTALLAFETLFFIFCVAYLLGSLAQERIASQHVTDAQTDPLTAVANRRGFFARGENLVRRAKLDRQSAALLLFDLDDFKRINDTYGHRAGDRMLSAFSLLATRSLRPTDLFGRIGGEEFACLLADMNAGDAVRIAERIRNEFAASPLEFGSARIHDTVSIGIAALESGYQTLSELVLAADQALYRAKANGRNRTEVAAPMAAADHKLAEVG